MCIMNNILVVTITKNFFFIDLEMSMDLIISNTHTYKMYVLYYLIH